MIRKEVFLPWSKNGLGPDLWAEMLEAQYITLLAMYRQQGMEREAELFANVAKEFKRIMQEIKELSAE